MKKITYYLDNNQNIMGFNNFIIKAIKSKSLKWIHKITFKTQYSLNLRNKTWTYQLINK